MKPTYIAGLVILAIASFLAGRWRSQPAAASVAPHRVLYYRDPMHPAYKSDKPGVAPDCGMKLEAVYADALPESAVAPPGAVHISPEKQQLVGLRTVEASRRSGVHLLRTSGRVVPDETRVYKIAPKFEGWIRQVFPVTTGTYVKKGQPLVSIYGNEYAAAQQAYIYALNGLAQVRRSRDPARDFAGATPQVDLQMAETLANLQNLSMDPRQIDEIARLRQVQVDTRLTAPADGFIVARNVFFNQKFDAGAELFRIVDLSHVWIVADIFADDDRWFSRGSPARVRVAGSQQSVYTARVSDILPQFDAATHTLKLRLETDNPTFALRPDMLADVEIQVTLPPAVIVPSDAVIDSGRNAIVYVERGNGYFEPRTVETGWRMDNEIAITRGLEPGERVVAEGAFLVDSESRLRAGAVGRP